MEFDIKSQDDKIANMTHLLKKVKRKNVKSDLEMQWLWSFHSRERVSDFSLEIHAIGPLDFDGARRENVLRGAGYAWTPGLRVFDNSKR